MSQIIAFQQTRITLHTSYSRKTKCNVLCMHIAYSLQTDTWLKVLPIAIMKPHLNLLVHDVMIVLLFFLLNLILL